MHMANHPETEHYQEDVWQVDPVKATAAGRWRWRGSSDCTHHSSARRQAAGQEHPRLAWVACRWAAKVRPRVIIVENVEEFRTWGPLNRRRRPKRNRKGRRSTAGTAAARARVRRAVAGAPGMRLGAPRVAQALVHHRAE